MVNWAKPWLSLPAGLAHKLSHPYLKIYGKLHPAHIPSWSEFHWRGLTFRNPLGIAGGVDKNGELVEAFWSLGCGFIEVGTVTPVAQDANPGCILRRSVKQVALWNKMGFPNKGATNLKANLKKLKRPFPAPIFVNIGKNRSTPNENAALDYITCIKELEDVADAFVVNISSPNTTGLRELLKPEPLSRFLQPILQSATGPTTKKPILLKLSPDLSDQELKDLLDLTLQMGISGWILTNTTLDRSLTPHWPTEGGVSGRPLAKQSEHLLKIATSHLGDRKGDRLIVSVGGVMTSDDVFHRLRSGADLIQVYSALVFEGPQFFKHTAKRVSK